MSQQPQSNDAAHSKGGAKDVAEKLRRSRQRLLDLTLRNRLLNFRPGNPQYRDDQKAHKHVVLKGIIESAWRSLVDEKKQIEIVGLTRDQQTQLAQEIRFQSSARATPSQGTTLSLPTLGHEQWEDLRGSIRGMSQYLQKGNLISLLPEEAFRKRLTKVRSEQNTLSNSTGDSALFLAIGFLEWCEADPHPKANEPLFAPLVLVHVALDQRKTEEGGEREFLLHMDADEPQGNPCLAEKLRQDFSIDLPDLDLEDNETATEYFIRVGRAMRTKKNWRVHPTIALGFFNFARYRLWLDLNPSEWPGGQSPTDHPIVGAILNGEPLQQQDGIPDDDAVAKHQEAEDLPIVMDADSTQYAALLAAQKDVSLVVQGPPGSGKSQTITNLISIAIAHGKRVLFVAQKLPALQVVQRRLESVELAPFCLPLFSDKARVTEVHKHLAGSARLRERPDRQRTPGNGFVAAAKRLNEHAARLRDQPAGFTQSACSLIQRAVALQLMLREAWGIAWHDDLLAITVPKTEAQAEWLEKREQTLYQWHRLKSEVGNAWANWTPLKLGPMDSRQLESIVREQQRAVLSLSESLALLPHEFHQLTVASVEQLSGKVRRSRFNVLRDVLPNLLGFLRQAPENATAVARFERDLEEFSRHLLKAQLHLRITDENRQYVGSRAMDALNAIAPVVSPRCSISSAKDALGELNDLLRLADDLCAYATLSVGGVDALCRNVEQGSDKIEIAWKHLELLANHRTSPNLDVPSGARVLLALHVLEDTTRKSDARLFAQDLSIFHECSKRLESRIANSTPLPVGILSAGLDEPIRCLCENALGRFSLCELTDLNTQFEGLTVALHEAHTNTPSGFADEVFCHDEPTVGDYLSLASLASIPAKLLQTPSNGTEAVLRRVIGMDSACLRLKALGAAIRCHQYSYKESVNWFPDIKLGKCVDAATLATQTEAALAVRQLGLQHQSVASIPQSVEKIERLRKAVLAATEAFQNLFEPWPLLPPETLEEIQQAKALFLLLLKRPHAPNDLPVETLCFQANAATVEAAVIEGRELREFREHNSERVAFRDLPDPETLAAQRRELRSLAGYWWRWFSGRYHKTRNAIRSFLNPPFPTDEDTLSLLDQLESHERQRMAFQGSPVNLLLGEHFRGIDTNWQTIEPTLAWIRELQAATQASEVVAFVQSSTGNTEGLRSAIRAVEVLTHLIDQDGAELATLVPLAFISANPKSVKLRELSAALAKTEAHAKNLSEQILSQARLHPEATFADLAIAIGRLEEFNQSQTLLEGCANLIEPSLAAKLTADAIDEDAEWIAELSQRGVPFGLIDAIAARKVNADAHAALINSAQLISRRMQQLHEVFQNSGIPSWMHSDTPSSTFKTTLTLLAESAAKAQTQALSSRFNDNLRVTEIAESLDDVRKIIATTEAFPPWRKILREDPARLSVEQIETTLEWIETLCRHGASGAFLRWLLTEETDNRLHWWQELVSRANDLRSRILTLQDSFTLPLHDTQLTTTVNAWSWQIADQIAKTTSALEVIESHSQSADFTVHDLAQSTAALCRAIELEAGLEAWREILGSDPTRIEVARVQNHRRWAAIAHGLPTSIEAWLAAADTTSRCETLIGIEAKLATLATSVKNTRDCIVDFGPISSDGPFAILSLSGTPTELEERCCAFVANLPLLPHYAALLREQENARKLGLTSLLKHCEHTAVSTDTLIQTFRGAVAWQQARVVWESDDDLRYFQSNEHERLRRKFQDEDDKQLAANRRFIKNRVGNGDVTQGSKGRTAGEHTDYALLQHELGKQRRHLPIRKLIHRAGRAMQDLCPCWMMTPLAVAQFLAPGTIHFDVVIMDEASQINPEDAWGVITRGKQLIVVGDQKQMPPSDFFMSALEDDESPENDDEVDGGKSESILDASVASLLSSALLWHYRSRQETLIAPANSFSYDNRLILFPHPHRTHPELGIRYHYIENATTTSGKVTNVLEASAVAKRVRELVLREYAKPAKNRLTLGVVTMNLYQQDAVNDLLDKMRQDDRRLDLAMTALLAEQNEEPLFVRNLENIQGDERDIMLISCTYGPHTPGGTPTQRFGPLNREGGERRFNVLITRAKWRMEVFASIRSDQILVDGKGQGVRDFHMFLKYAESGVLAEPGEATGKPSDSPFEVQVEAVLQRAGFSTERQVGVAGYFIDLAVKHPQHPGLFAIGVECDGYTYHSSRAARDRDRLREKVLIERGWKLHRIWSTDWFISPQQAKKRLLEAVTAACR